MMRRMTSHRPWFRKWRDGVPKTLEPYPDSSVFSLLADAAAGFPNRPAVAFLGKHFTYRKLLSEVERFSAVLAGFGVKKGDRVGLLLPNCPQYVIAWYACQRIGAVAVGNNPLYTQRELAHQVKDSSPRVMVVLDQLHPSWAAIENDVGAAEIVVTKLTDYMRFPLSVLAPIKFRKDARHEGKPWPPVPTGAGVRWWKQAMRRAGAIPPPAQVDAAKDVSVLIYTGGTTGPSKGAMLSHRNVVSNVLQVAPCITDFVRGRDAVMCILPFFHSFGCVAMNFGIAQAGKLVMLPRFELHMALKQIAKERPTFFPGVPRDRKSVV